MHSGQSIFAFVFAHEKKCPKIYEVINVVSVSYIMTRNYFLLVLIVFKNVTLCALNISYPSFVNLG